MTLTRSEVAHMGAVIACEVNALKRYVDKIKNTARRSDEHLEAQIEAIAEALVYTMKRVDRLRCM